MLMNSCSAWSQSMSSVCSSEKSSSATSPREGVGGVLLAWLGWVRFGLVWLGTARPRGRSLGGSLANSLGSSLAPSLAISLAFWHFCSLANAFPHLLALFFI